MNGSRLLNIWGRLRGTNEGDGFHHVGDILGRPGPRRSVLHDHVHGVVVICEAALALCLSQGAFLGSTAVDLASSKGLYETNPILGRGPFSAKQAVNASLIAAGVVLGEHFLIKKWPKSKKALIWVNFGLSGEHLGAAFHNFRQ